MCGCIHATISACKCNLHTRAMDIFLESFVIIGRCLSDIHVRMCMRMFAPRTTVLASRRSSAGAKEPKREQELPWLLQGNVQHQLDVLRNKKHETPWRRAACLATPQHMLHKARSICC